jgi:hypothetical protein
MIDLDASRKEWTAEQITRISLQWLRLQTPGEVMCLWDSFAAYQSLVTKSEAQTLGIRVEFILVGMTG